MTRTRPAVSASARRFAITSITLILIAFASASHARMRFEEGDWIAWGDARDVRDMAVGNRTVYVATNNGILRWDRLDETWLFPWFSVPGQFDDPVFLRNCTRVREDPSTLDVYVRSSGQWYIRDISTMRWRSVPSLTESQLQILQQNAPDELEAPPQGMIVPIQYDVTIDNDLEYRFARWSYATGVSDGRNMNFMGWSGYGVGVSGMYNMVLELYPGGPGPSPYMDVSEDEIWCAGTLNRENGWIWHRERDGDRWEFFHPDMEWGLDPAKINRLRIGPDGIVWLATDEGVMYCDDDDWRWLRRQDGLPSRVIRDIAPGNGHAWIATEFGLAKIDASSGAVMEVNPHQFPIPANEPIYRVTYDGTTLYAAGVSRILRKAPNEAWELIEPPLTVSASTPPRALFVEDGFLAIGDRYGIAWQQVGDDSWNQAMKERWFGGVVRSLCYHDDFFWIGTDRGLIKYHPVEGDAIQYTRQEGLAGNTVSEIIPEGDWLWLGTDWALVRFHWNVVGRID